MERLTGSGIRKVEKSIIYDKASLDEQLQELAAARQMEASRSLGAMCYRVSPTKEKPLKPLTKLLHTIRNSISRLSELVDNLTSPAITSPAINAVKYICPICGQQSTMLEGRISSFEQRRISSFEQIRTIVNNLKALGFDVQLDESEFCACECFDSLSMPDMQSHTDESWYEKTPKEENPELIFRIKLSGESEYHIARSNSEYDYLRAYTFLTGNAYNKYKVSALFKSDIEKMLGIKLSAQRPSVQLDNDDTNA
jgi:hypothetical protein